MAAPLFRYTIGELRLCMKMCIRDRQRALFHEVIDNPDNNWMVLLKSLWADIDPGVLQKVLENFLVNASLVGLRRQDAAAAEHGCNVPWALLVDPTSACNLHCTGCWAAEYGDRLNLTFERCV